MPTPTCSPPVPPSSPLITEGGTVNESATVTITCEATGFPAPRIIWLKKNGTELTNLNLFIQIPSSRIFIKNSVPTEWESCELLSSSNLTIDSVTVEDNGMYVCEVENGLQSHQMNSTNISVIGKYFMVKLLIFSFVNFPFVVCIILSEQFMMNVKLNLVSMVEAVLICSRVSTATVLELDTLEATVMRQVRMKNLFAKMVTLIHVL